MMPLFAVGKLTVRMALRSKIFLMLFLMLALAVLVLPGTVLDDGTPIGHIRLSIQYCITALTMILTISTVWVSCFVCSSDIENYQMHMLSTKPLSRTSIWIGKFLGVFLLHFFLLVVCGVIAYARILYEFNSTAFSPEDKERIRHEIFVGRRVYMPELPDVEAEIKREYERRLAELKELGLNPSSNPTDPMKSQPFIDAQLRKQTLAKLGEVRFGPSASRIWEYENVSKVLDRPVFLRFRPYVDQISQKEQRETYGIWFFRIKTNEKMMEDMRKEAPDLADSKPEYVFIPYMPEPERFAGGAFNEFPIPPQVIGDDGKVAIAYANYDLGQKPVYFQLSDGPKLLVRKDSFLGNFLRAILMLSIKLLFVGALACSLGGVFSMPCAVFICVAYILFGVFSDYMISIDEMYNDGMEEKLDLSSLEAVHDYVGKKVSRFIVTVAVPVQRLDVSDKLSDGELIENSAIAVAFFKYFILRGLPLFVFFVWLYSKRELGAVIRK